MNRYYKKKLNVFFLAALAVVLFAASAFGAGNMYLINNIRVFPGLIDFSEPNPATKPVISLDNASWVQEEVYIEAPIDFDEDGQRDLLCFQYGIPAAAVSTDNILLTPLLLCPTILTASPYAGGSVASVYSEKFNYQLMEPKVDGPWPGENNPSTMNRTYKDVENVCKLYSDIVAANFKPSWLPAERATWVVERRGTYRGNTAPNRVSAWFNYFRSRGYAYGTLFMIGSARSEGFCANKTYDEAIGAAAVVDWLNGRVKAYRYPYKVRLATSAEIAAGPHATNNIGLNTDGKFILDNKYIRDDLNGGWVEVKAYWATGDAAMSGTSYDGALPLMAMSTGVEGLRCVIPFASVAGSYEYYRDNGTVIAAGGFQGEDIPEYFPYCGGRMYRDDAVTNPIKNGNNYPEIWNTYYKLAAEAMASVERETGNYNAYYDNRNMSKYAPGARDGGVVIMWHGINDLNVKFKNASVWAEAWKKAPGVTLKLVFNLGKHGAPWNVEGFGFIPKIHGVLDKLMYGIENTALENWPNLIIQNGDTLGFEEYDKWPINDRYQKFYPTGDRVGALSINKPKEVKGLDFVDVKALSLVRPTGYPQMAAAQYTAWKHNLIGGSDTPLSNDAPFNIQPNDDRLMYLLDISEDTRISGYIKMTAKAAADRKVGGISAMLVDLGADNYVHRTFASTGTMGSTQNTGNEVVYYPGSTAALTRQLKNTNVDPWNVFSRGTISVQKPNYTGKTWIDFPEDNFVPPYYYQTEVIEPGKFYPYTWALSIMDYTVKAGHKLALILYGTDPEYSQRPLTNPTKITVEIGPDTYLTLPLVGEFITAEVPDPTGPVNIADLFVDGKAPTGAEIIDNMLVWKDIILDEGIILDNAHLNGYEIAEIVAAGLGVGYTFEFDGDKVIVVFDSKNVVEGTAEIYLFKDGNTTGIYDEVLHVKFSGHATTAVGKKGGGGCNAGLAFFTVIALSAFIIRGRK